MDNTEYREALGFLLGLTVGAVIGTATALILAPQSGARTRRQIAPQGGGVDGLGG